MSEIDLAYEYEQSHEPKVFLSLVLSRDARIGYPNHWDFVSISASNGGATPRLNVDKDQVSVMITDDDIAPEKAQKLSSEEWMKLALDELRVVNVLLRYRLSVTSVEAVLKMFILRATALRLHAEVT